MADFYKYTARFNWNSGEGLGRDVALAPGQRNHVGSWTESVWSLTGPTNANIAKLDAMWTSRSSMLPAGSTISDYRYQKYTLPDNAIRLVPGGAKTQGFAGGPKPGNVAYTANHPNDCLKVPVSGAGVTNKSLFYLHCVPDRVVEGGELLDNANFTRQFNAWKANVLGQGFGWVGLNVTPANSAIISMTNMGVVTLLGAIPGLANGMFVSFYRAVDQNGNPVKGVFQATNVDGVTLTLSPNPGKVITQRSGLLRLVNRQFISYDEIDGANLRVITRKIGSAVKNYVGRRSRRR